MPSFCLKQQTVAHHETIPLAYPSQASIQQVLPSLCPGKVDLPRHVDILAVDLPQEAHSADN